MTTKHTSGPWKQVGSCFTAVNEDEELMEGCVKAGRYQSNLAREGADCARIVSCVNACEGINPDAVPDMLEALKELLAMGQAGIIQRNETGKPTWSILAAIKTITQAAIIKAEGNG